ncbi:MAG: hypothetical protein SFU87_13490, partial [Chitinophagaceae bacterium]|nr:hypothetical protein [Chitinophagaceae bacterium]
TKSVCPLECLPGLLIANIILKSRMNREVQVRFCEEQGVKSPLLTRLDYQWSVKKLFLPQNFLKFVFDKLSELLAGI